LYQVRRAANVTGLISDNMESFGDPGSAISAGMGAICFGMSFIPGLGHPFLNIVLGAGDPGHLRIHPGLRPSKGAKRIRAM